MFNLQTGLGSCPGSRSENRSPVLSRALHQSGLRTQGMHVCPDCMYVPRSGGKTGVALFDNRRLESMCTDRHLPMPAQSAAGFIKEVRCFGGIGRGCTV